jgi:hypothetical protein
MYRPDQSDIDKVTDIVAEAATLPLPDAAFALWCQRYRLDTFEGRPTEEEVRVNRSLSPEQWKAKYRFERDHADEGPMFGYLKRAHPRADDAAIAQAIITAVKFEDECFMQFKWDGDFWACVVQAVAQATAKFPDYLDTTYRDARNNVAYYMK